ncbi:MAG: ATP-binding protein [Caldilineaceae bacterium]
MSLAAALAWLRARLEDRQDVPSSWTPLAGLSLLQERLSLSDFETQTLLLAVAPEVEPALGTLYAAAQGGANYPTLALAAACLDAPAWESFAPEGPLRRWRLVQITATPGHPLLTSPLTADERVVGLVRGLNQLDARLRPYLTPQVQADLALLTPTQLGQVDRLEQILRAAPAAQRWPVIQLTGADGVSKRLVAQALAERLQGAIYNLPAHLLPAGLAELDDLARLWHRESLLLPVILAIDLAALEDEGGGPDLSARVRQFLHRSGGITLLETREARHDLGTLDWAIEIARPTVEEQIGTWELALPAELRPTAGHLASLFHLDTPAILRIGNQVAATHADQVDDESAVAITDDKVDLVTEQYEAVWRACLQQTQPQLDRLAQRITPRATWDDIVLPAEQLVMLRVIASQIEQRSRVYDQWGFRARSGRGLGTTVLFAGESGTGKTMAAEVLANELQLNLYRIDLSGVVSKFIGETEKNLRRLFDAAENGGAILFFDEADALFGKRSEVRDSHDRYANIEVNYLLQRLEAYQGLAILATNMKSGLDSAFMRRLRITITFRMPDETHRRLLWERAFPDQTPVEELDVRYLAKSFVMSGGSIQNAALNASFLAAARGEAVGMTAVLQAIRMELSKEDRLLDDRYFMWESSSPS